MNIIIALFKRICFFSILILLFACPSSDDNCDDYGSTTRVDDLITLTPIQETYNQGDEVILKATFPATNSYFGREINLLSSTNDYSARLTLGFDQLFIGNNLDFIKGSQSEFPNWFNILYNSDTQNYEFELKIILNRLGKYTFVTTDTIEINGDNCNRYRIDTNVIWNGMARIEFIVE